VKKRVGGRSARVRAAVLAATTEVLAAEGYEACTVDAVAARAGVHKTTIYRRWPDKRTLVLDALHARSDAIIDIPETGDFGADMFTFLRGVVTATTNPLGRALLSAFAAAGGDDHVREQFWDERFARATTRVDAAILAGDLPAGTKPELFVEALVSPIHFRVAVRGAPVDDDYLRAIMQLHRIAPGNRTTRGTT
jgi:AcrR family transcriptional regulator